MAKGPRNRVDWSAVVSGHALLPRRWDRDLRSLVKDEGVGRECRRSIRQRPSKKLYGFNGFEECWLSNRNRVRLEIRRSSMVVNRSRCFAGLWLAIWATVAVTSCGGHPSIGVQVATDAATASPPNESATARSILSALRKRSPTAFPAGLAQSFESLPDGLRPRFTVGKPSARIRFPDISLAAVHIEDVGSDAAIDVALQDALIVDAEPAEGYVVYPNAHASGATLLHHALPDGLEDYLSFETAPKTPEISYKLSLRNGVAGLRLISGALELLDATGTPRLRVSPPYIVGADGTQTNALLAVEGCAYDRSGAPPWGRKVTPPGAKTCTVRVSWNDDVAYPAVLDPRWTTTATSMVASRTTRAPPG